MKKRKQISDHINNDLKFELFDRLEEQVDDELFDQIDEELFKCVIDGRHIDINVVLLQEHVQDYILNMDKRNQKVG